MILSDRSAGCLSNSRESLIASVLFSFSCFWFCGRSCNSSWMDVASGCSPKMFRRYRTPASWAKSLRANRSIQRRRHGKRFSFGIRSTAMSSPEAVGALRMPTSLGKSPNRSCWPNDSRSDVLSMSTSTRTIRAIRHWTQLSADCRSSWVCSWFRSMP